MTEDIDPTRPEEYIKVEMELEREKITLERERLAHEREKLSLERLKMQADSDFFDSRRRYVVVPPLAIAVAALFLLIGLGLGAYFLKDGRISVGRRKLEEPIHLKAEIDGIERGASPLFGLLLSEGTHRVVAIAADGTRDEQLFEVDDQNLEVTFDSPASR